MFRWEAVIVWACVGAVLLMVAWVWYQVSVTWAHAQVELALNWDGWG